MGILAVTAVWIEIDSSSRRLPTQKAAPFASKQQAPDKDSVAVFGGGPNAEAVFGGTTGLVELSRRAVDGSAEAQFELATNYECGQPKDLREALHWYELAAAQGHAPSREVLARLRAPLPTEVRAKDVESLQRDMDCSARLRKSTAKVFDTLNDKAGLAAKHIKRD